MMMPNRKRSNERFELTETAESKNRWPSRKGKKHRFTCRWVDDVDVDVDVVDAPEDTRSQRTWWYWWMDGQGVLGFDASARR